VTSSGPNSTEFTSNAILAWEQDRDVEAELARFEKETLRRLRSADAAKRAGRTQSEPAPDPRGAGA